jgi:hypothetical protein
MPRIRTLKPECWADEEFEGLSRDARLLFVGLVTQADDEGRQKAHPALLKGAIYPYDLDLGLDEIEAWLGELQRARLVLRYEVEGRAFLHLRGWHKNQRIDRPQESKLPAPPDGEGDAPEPFRAPAVPKRERKPKPSDDVLPEGFPGALAQFVEPVRALLAEVAADTGAGATLPSVAAVARAILDHDGRDFIPEARAYRAWAIEKARTKHKDPVRGYRNWLGRAPRVVKPTPLADAGAAGAPIADRTAANLRKAGLA